MRVNIHTHTIRCGHAVGQDEEYIQKAIEAGMEELGFSDHAYRIPTEDKRKNFVPDVEKYIDYIISLRELKEKYKNQIKIHIGFETEYNKDYFEEALTFYKSIGAEYLLLGQHDCNSEDHQSIVFSGKPNSSIEAFDDYIETCLSGMKTGYFSYLAHPDLFNFSGDIDVYIQKMKYFVSQIKENNIPIEYNLQGYRGNKNYPNQLFWEIVADEKIDAIIGIDAHNPDYLNDVDTIKNRENYLHKLGIKIVDPQIVLL